ncbi:hypothetical protein ACTU45_30790 [Streptomyces sp. 24-1644]|uniref:hypothetical protein n=1 Tax=Streptomyces sp. 24-1644 TaxID=3457315 RepID=UPI003FA7D37A
MSVVEPWQGRSPGELAEDIQTGHGNKTARIAVDTMIPLLDWALRIVEDIGPDIRDAWQEFRRLHAGTHPGQARFAGLPRTERMNLFLRDAHRTGVALPGDPENPGAIDYKYLACLLGLPAPSNSIGLGLRSIAEASGVRWPRTSSSVVSLVRLTGARGGTNRSPRPNSRNLSGW